MKIFYLTAFILTYNCNELVYLLAWQFEALQAIYIFWICIEWATGDYYWTFSYTIHLLVIDK